MHRPLKTTWVAVLVVGVVGVLAGCIAYADTATILGGSGDGGFPYEPLRTVPLGLVAFGDLDGDGLPEAVGITADSRGIVVHPNTAVT